MKYLNLLADMLSWKLKRSSQYAGLRKLGNVLSHYLYTEKQTLMRLKHLIEVYA